MLVFKRAIPVDPEKLMICEKYKAVFYVTDDGLDWYDYINHIPRGSTVVKLSLDHIVLIIEKDPTMVCPEGGIIDVLETPPAELAVGWVYKGGTYMPAPLDLKKLRKSILSKLTVTTTAGNVFDADETSQHRMDSMLKVLADGESTKWVLSDNTLASITKEELHEAYVLSVKAFSAAWLQPYA